MAWPCQAHLSLTCLDSAPVSTSASMRAHKKPRDSQPPLPACLTGVRSTGKDADDEKLPCRSGDLAGRPSMTTMLSRRSLLRGVVGFPAVGTIAPILLSIDAAAADTV